MNKLLTVLMLALPLVTTSAFAQDKQAADKKAPTAQQGKMASCNKDAGDKKGDERKAFMKDCLSKDAPAPAADAKTANQKKFGDCSASLKGQKLAKDERSAKMKECMAK